MVDIKAESSGANNYNNMHTFTLKVFSLLQMPDTMNSYLYLHIYIFVSKERGDAHVYVMEVG